MSISLKITAFISSIIMSFISLFSNNLNYKYKVAVPVFANNPIESEKDKVIDADFYISTFGNDLNDGSFSSPFATFEKAMEAVSSLDKSESHEIVVAVMSGDYRVNSLDFSNQNNKCRVKYTSFGDGEVIINGGITLNAENFSEIKDKTILNRLSKKAGQSVLCYDLKKDGITAEDYGRIYAIGSYNTAYKYTGDTTGPLYCELFVNDSRMTLSRYPNNGYLYTDKVISTGQGRESGNDHIENPEWNTIVNPESDVYSVSKLLSDRINSWKTLEDVWMFGFWKYDWADASSPIGSFDYANRTISPKYVSMYGTKEKAPYYFFNVLEELDSPGEWYLDRDAGILYLYPDCDIKSADIDLSLSVDSIIKGNNLNNITFEGFTVKGTRCDGVTITGNNITIRNCLIKNVAGNAVSLTGCNNTVEKCEITHTGKGGIYIAGGDSKTLTPGNSKADNNLIHDWSEIYQTYQPAVTLYGTGNACSHNEIFNSPHEAVTYFGNNHIIEYNLIHDVCLLSDDAGAIYAGRSWNYYGNIVRYNCIYNLGSEDHKPDGIYFDDALSGQTAYGNILINIPKYGFHIGGGRDMDIRNNIIVNTGERAISYDSRAIEGVYGGWFNHSSTIDSGLWVNLFDSPWQSETWQNAYPQMKRFSSDFSDPNNPDFVPNPAYSTVTGNIIVNLNGKIGYISESADKYSNISNNAIFNMLQINSIFSDYATGDYSLKTNSLIYNEIPDFETIPLNEIGRY